MKKVIENVNNQMHNTVSGEESLSPLEIAAKKYDKGAHSGQFAGEDPSYHFINGAEWQQSHSEPSGKEKSEVKGDAATLAEKWVFEINGDKWSNNDDTAGDNYGSFIAGYTAAEKAKDATISELQEQLRKNEGEVYGLKEIADAAYTLLSCVPIESGSCYLSGFTPALADWQRLNYQPKK